MFNNQEVGLGLGNDVGLLGVKDLDDYMINGLKWNNLEQFDIHLQVVPDLHQNDEILIKDANQEVGYESLLVPDEHSETGDDHHHHGQQQHHHDHIYYSNLHNKKEKQPKRRRRRVHQILTSSSDEESSDSRFTREVPSVTRKVCKRRQRRRGGEMMSHKMFKLQQLLPNSHKFQKDEVSVLDNAIDYMKDLRLQIQVMTMMGINPCMASPYPYGMHNHPSTALTMSHGQIPSNQATSPPFIPASKWPLMPITNLSSYSFSPQSPFGLVPCFPSFMDPIGRF